MTQKHNETTEEYTLQLYISGATQLSVVAIRNVKQICEQYLSDRYSLEIIDVFQQPTLASDKNVIATPTLINVGLAGTKRLIGDMSDIQAVIDGLGISRSLM